MEWVTSEMKLSRAPSGQLAAFAGGAVKDVVDQKIQAEHAAERADVAHGAEDHFERTGII